MHEKKNLGVNLLCSQEPCFGTFHRCLTKGYVRLRWVDIHGYILIYNAFTKRMNIKINALVRMEIISKIVP